MMDIRCPRCSNSSIELMECENCSSIGCERCMKRSSKRWVCFKCEKPNEAYTYQEQKSSANDLGNVLSGMFG